MLRASAASKKKNDQVDARKITDLLRCDLLPECYMAPGAFRERRGTLRYRNLLVRQSVQMKNRIAACGWRPESATTRRSSIRNATSGICCGNRERFPKTSNLSGRSAGRAWSGGGRSSAACGARWSRMRRWPRGFPG
jgi:hypothetical protein